MDGERERASLWNNMHNINDSNESQVTFFERQTTERMNIIASMF